jgi:hypothetical protein
MSNGHQLLLAPQPDILALACPDSPQSLAIKNIHSAFYDSTYSIESGYSMTMRNTILCQDAAAAKANANAAKKAARVDASWEKGAKDTSKADEKAAQAAAKAAAKKALAED